MGGVLERGGDHAVKNNRFARRRHGDGLGGVWMVDVAEVIGQNRSTWTFLHERTIMKSIYSFPAPALSLANFDKKDETAYWAYENDCFSNSNGK